jgi:tetratricopeptide (TPR) repeat protein/tRNA A-37 threonylcarbamoyl transferase component Bud32
MQIGAYQVTEELARGGMGAVYRAQDASGKPVAIKVLLARTYRDATARRRFATEAKALTRLDHAHVVRVLDSGEHQGHPFLVLELVEGESLDVRLEREGPLPMEEALRYTIDVAWAIEHVHERHLLHRDLKPSNVLLTREGEAKVTDFGLAKDLDASLSSPTLSGHVMGTPGYWSPEQAFGRLDQIGPATDVYGLGATLYALLTGRAPFQGSSIVEVMGATDNVIPTAPSRLAPGRRDLDAVVLRCLEKDPRRRYASAGDVARALERVLEARPPRRAGWLLPGGLVVGAVVLAGVAFAVAQGDEPTANGGASARAPIDDAGSSPAPADAQGEPGESPGGADLDPGAAPPGHERAPADALAQEAQEAFEAGDLAGAQRLCDQALAADPDHQNALWMRSVVRHLAGDRAGAVEDATRLIELLPDRAGPLLTRAGILAAEEPAKALKDLDAAFALSPGDEEILDRILSERAKVYERLGDLPAAIADTKRLRERSPRRVPLLVDLAKLHKENGAPLLALSELDRAADINPDSTLVLYERGVLRANTGDLVGARQDLDRLIAIQPKHALAHADRGLVSKAQGRLAEALTDFDRAMELMGSSFRYKTARQQVQAQRDAVASALAEARGR